MEIKVKVNCILCRRATDLFSYVCVNCQSLFPSLNNYCPLCAQPIIIESSSTSLCARCLRERPFFDIVISSYLYEFPIDRIIQKIKYDRHLELLPIIGKMLAKKVEQCYIGLALPEVIIPVPLHINRLRKRGFNQSSLIAKQVQKHLSFKDKIKIDNKIVARISDTENQQHLLYNERKRNVKKCFKISSSFTYKHVVILDDVVTSTATVNSLSRIMKSHDVRQIDIWSVARTPYIKKE